MHWLVSLRNGVHEKVTFYAENKKFRSHSSGTEVSSKMKKEEIKNCLLSTARLGNA